MKKVKIIFLLVVLKTLSSCLVDNDLNIEFKGYNPVEIDDGLFISTPEAENIDPIGLRAVYEHVFAHQDFWSLRSLLVFRNGNLVAEAYLKDPDDIYNQRLIWSCTKQVIGLLVGIAVQDGYINSVEDSIYNFFDLDNPKQMDKRNITINNLLTMQSGIEYNNEGFGGDTDILLRQIPENSIDFILNKPLKANHGTLFHYNDGDPHLLSAIIQNQTGKPTDIWANDVLFSKIGLSNYQWIRYKDGVTFGGFGIKTTPRGLGKIALLVYNQGYHGNEMIINPQWIEQMIYPHLEKVYDNSSFGYMWWIDQTKNFHYMHGHGGQFAFIVPDKDLVIVMTSFPNTQDDYQLTLKTAAGIVEKIIDISN